jgi:hypothetical protein
LTTLRRIKEGRHVARGANEKRIRNLIGKPGTARPIWGLDEAARIILTLMLKKYSVN